MVRGLTPLKRASSPTRYLAMRSSESALVSLYVNVQRPWGNSIFRGEFGAPADGMRNACPMVDRPTPRRRGDVGGRLMNDPTRGGVWSQPLEQVTEGMKVVDAAGEEVGKVEFIS